MHKSIMLLYENQAYKTFKALKDNVDEQQDLRQKSKERRESDLRNRCFKHLQQLAQQKKTKLIVFGKKRQQKFLNAFIEAVLIEINEKK